MMNVEEVWKSNAGTHLYNGITGMKLVDRRSGSSLIFSERIKVTEKVIELLLELGYLPEELHDGD